MGPRPEETSEEGVEDVCIRQDVDVRGIWRSEKSHAGPCSRFDNHAVQRSSATHVFAAPTAVEIVEFQIRRQHSIVAMSVCDARESRAERRRRFRTCESCSGPPEIGRDF